MTVFAISTPTVAAHTGALRRDAANLRPIYPPFVPTAGPAAAFGAAAGAALDAANTRAAELSCEAFRIADAMDLAASAADAVDGSTGQSLGGLL